MGVTAYLTVMIFKEELSKELIKVHLIIQLSKILLYIFIGSILLQSISLTLNYCEVFTPKAFDYWGLSIYAVLGLYFLFNFIFISLEWYCILCFFSYGYSNKWVTAGIFLYKNLSSTTQA
jgi:hypothetical protein